jgi:hypothetical protein
VDAGVSDASGMLTSPAHMWLLVYVLFVYGLKSVWMPWVADLQPDLPDGVSSRSGSVSRTSRPVHSDRASPGNSTGAKLSTSESDLRACQRHRFIAYAFKGIGNLRRSFSLKFRQMYAMILMSLTAPYA